MGGGTRGLKRARKLLVRTLIVLFFFWSPIESVNPASRLATIDSIRARGTVATEGSWFFNTVDMVYVDGHFYSDKPPLLSLYSAALIRPIHKIVTFADPGWRFLYFLVVLTGSGVSLLAIFLLLRTLRRRFPERSPTLGWLFAAVVGATCLLPFARTYNDHIVEAALILGVFALLIQYRATAAPWVAPVAGLLIGTIGLLHPLPGVVFGGLTLLYFGAAPALHSRQTRHLGGVAPTAVARSTAGAAGSFAVAAVAVAAAGIVIHNTVYGTPIPFYFSPELYYWAGVPGFPDSAWLVDPSTPGLTAGRLTERFAALAIPDSTLTETLSLHAAYQESVRNPFTFAASRFFEYDQLTLNPLVVFCLFLGVAAALRADFEYRLEWMWALLGMLGLLAATVYLRAVPGGSFGDRMLLPALPIVVCTGAFALMSPGRRYVFRTLVLVGVAMMLPGAVGPWTRPATRFLTLSLVVGLMSVAGIVWFFASPRSDELVARLGRRAEEAGPRLVPATFVLLVLLFLVAYMSSYQFAL
jgi:hypothetical protein